MHVAMAYYILQNFLNRFTGFRAFASFLQPRQAFFIAYLGCNKVDLAIDLAIWIDYIA